MALRPNLHGRYVANIPPLYTITLTGIVPADCPLYAFSLFLPSIIAGLGYKSTKAQLLSVPPYAAAAILTITIGCEYQPGAVFVGYTFANGLKTSPIEHANEAYATSSPLSWVWSASPCL